MSHCPNMIIQTIVLLQSTRSMQTKVVKALAEVEQNLLMQANLDLLDEHDADTEV